MGQTEARLRSTSSSAAHYTPADRVVLVESNTSGTGAVMVERICGLGLTPTLISSDPARYPFANDPRVDVVEVESTNRREIAEACDGLQHAGSRLRAITSTSEYYIALAAGAARDRGLPAPDPDAVERCRDKRQQRAALELAGVSVPAFGAARTPKEAVETGLRLGFPVVCKPVAGSGSVGVRLCRDVEELRRHATEALTNSDADEREEPREAVLVETYVRGPEVSAEVVGGTAVGLVTKHVGVAPTFIETGHDFPAHTVGEERLRVSRCAERAVAALGLDWGDTHVELRLTSRGPEVIEVNPRLAGGMIPVLIEATSGLDLVAGSLARALGAGTSFDVVGDSVQHGSLRFLVVDRPVRVGSATGGLENCRDVIGAALTRPPGTTVVPAGDFRDRVGYVLSRSSTPRAAAVAADCGIAILRRSLTSLEGSC